VRADRGPSWAASGRGTVIVAGRSTRSLYVVMRTWGALAFVLVLSGCASTCPSSDAPLIVGLWELKPLPTNSYGLSASCRATVEYRADGTFLTRNGDMEIVGNYRLGAGDGVSYLCEWGMRGNGGKSCQGVTSDFVISHAGTKRRAVIDGDVLTVYSLSSSTRFVFERRTGQ
jgi:hypothetical protein